MSGFSDAERAHLTDPKANGNARLPYTVRPITHDEIEPDDEGDRQVRRVAESTRCALLANQHAGVRSEA